MKKSKQPRGGAHLKLSAEAALIRDMVVALGDRTNRRFSLQAMGRALNQTGGDIEAAAKMLESRKVVYMSQGDRRSLSGAEADDVLYHGGTVRMKGPYPPSAAKEARFERDFEESMERGLRALESGSSKFAPDAEPVPGAAVEVLDLFDVSTGEHVMVWRVACRERSEGGA